MAYSSRNEYLKMLNQMRSNYQNNGNAMINTMDDSTAVGEELSSFAYMNTPTPSMPQEQGFDADAYKEDRNWWQRSMDTGEEFMSNVTEGVWNFVDDVGDFLIMAGGWIGSLFGADTQWAEDAIAYDWSTQAHEATMVFNPFDILSGDVFSSQYYQDMTKIGSVEGANELKAQRHAGSWMSETSDKFHSGYNNITTGIGELLPSLALAYFTGGASLGAQAAIQGGVTVAKVAGQSTESALNEGAGFNEAAAYGITKGTISGVITAATVGIGGSVLAKGGQGAVSKASQKVGEQVGRVFSNSATAEVIASKSTEIMMRAGIDAASAGAQSLLDPVLKQFTYDSDAIQKAYGSDEAIQNTLANMGNVMIQAGLTSAILSTGKEVVSGVKAGSFDQYKENYFVNKETRANYLKSEAYKKEYDKLCKEYYEKSGINSGKLLSKDDFIKLSMEYSNKIEKLGSKYNVNQLLKDISNEKSYNDTATEPYSGAIREANAQIGNTLRSRAVNNTLPKAIAYDYIKKSGWKTSSDNGSYTSSDGVLKLTYDDSTGASSLTTPHNPNSPIPLIENKATGEVALHIQTPNQAIAMISTLQNNGRSSNLPSTFVYNNESYQLTTRALKMIVYKEENKDNNLFGLKDGETALKYLNNNYTEEELRHLNNSKSQLITSGEELSNYIYNAINNPDSVKLKAIIGRITDSTAMNLQNDTGIDFNGFSLAYDKDNIRHIIKRHIENPKDNLPLEYNDLLKFPYIMENYDEASLGENKNTLIVQKWIGDKYQLVAEYSMKSNNLVLKSLYKTKKERNKSLPVVHDSNESLLGTSETQSGVSSSSNNNIPKVSGNMQEKNKLPADLVKDSAHLRKQKVYSLKKTEHILKNVLTNLKDKLPKNIDIKLSGSKESLIRKTFEEINLSKDVDNVVSNLIKQISEATIYFDKGTTDEISDKLGNYITPKIKSDLEKCIKGLIEHKGDQAKVAKLTERYLSIIDKLREKVRDAKVRTEYLIDSIKKINSINKKIEKSKTLRATGDMVVEDIQMIGKLIKGIKLSKSMKGISPTSITHFVENLRGYTPDLFEESLLGYNGDLKQIADYFEELFEDGKFPNRELTLEETYYFNKALKFINEMSKQLQSEKTKQMVEMVQQVNKETKFIKDNVPVSHYGMLKGIKDGTIGAPAFFSMVLGDEHPFTKLITSEYLDAYNARLKAKISFEKLVNITIPKEIGVKFKSISRALSKKIKYKDQKYTLEQLLEVYATAKANDEVFEVGFEFEDSKTKTNKTLHITKEEFLELEKLIPEQYRKYVDEVCAKGYNGLFKEYLSGKYKDLTGVDLDLVENYYPQTRGKLNNTGLESLNSNNRGFLTTANTSVIKKRTGSKSPFKIMGFSARLNDYINKVSFYGEFTEFIDKYRIFMNKKVDGISVNNMFNEIIPNWNGQKGWSEFLTRIILERPMMEKEGNSIFNTLYGNSVSAVLGANPSTVLKQFASEFALATYKGGSWGAWSKSLFRGIMNLGKWKKISSIIEENQPYFAERWKSNEVLKSLTGAQRVSKLTEWFGWAMEKADKAIIIGHGWAMAQYIAKQTGNGEYWTNENNIAASKILTEIVLSTQSHSQPMFTSKLRSGYLGPYSKQIFGVFGADNQIKTENLNRCVWQANSAKKRMDAYEKAMNQENISDEEKEFYQKGYNSSKKEYSKNIKLIPTFISSLLLSSIAVTIATMISQRLKGKEDWDEFDSKEFANDVLAETLWRWIPYVGTIANAIENNSDVSMITIDKMNEIISLSNTIREAIESGDDAKIIKAVDDFVTIIAEAFGFPATNLKDLIIGSIYQFDKEEALKIRSWTNGYSSQSMKTIYNANLEEGNVDRAKANLQVWSSMYSVYLDDNIANEIVSLEVQGYTATPKATITYYNDDKGQRIELTKVQQQEFNQYYKLANEHVSELMNISEYQTLDGEAMAKMIRKIYDTYYDYAKTKTLGVSSTNKMVNLLSITNGRLGLSKFVLGVNALSNIEATKNKTRKELVLERINKMRGYTKAEKLLLIYLCGFSLSDTNKTVLQSFLTQKGATLKDAKSLIN